jgi:hypothetical protein
MGWDIEARQEALARAQAVARRDPQASALLLAQLKIEEDFAREQQAKNVDVALPDYDAVYNPVRLYMRVAKYIGGWRISYMEEMDYVTFFACVQEATHMQEEEQRKYREAAGNVPAQHPGYEEMIIRSRAIMPRQYEGEVIPYG